MTPEMPYHARLFLGSQTDAPNGNVMLKIFKRLGVRCGVSILSCDRDSGSDFNVAVDSVAENIIVYLGGMDLAAPAVFAAILNNTGQFGKFVFAVPTDQAARSAIENRPMGNPIMTCGLNDTSLRHSLVNSALAVAKLAGMLYDNNILEKLKEWHRDFRREKPWTPDVTLKDGLIPIEQPK